MRVAWVSLLVASGVGVVGVVPALAADRSSAPAAVTSDHDRGRGHDRWFRDRGDVRYVWFTVCDGTTSTTTATTTAAEATTETVATNALAAAVEGAVEGAAAETATTTLTSETTTADDGPDAEAYPTFVVVPMPKDEAAALRKLDDRPCYDLTTGAPQTTATTTADTTTDTATATDTTTTTPTPAAGGTTG